MHKQIGQAIVEHIILWPVLILVTLGSIQLALLYRAKATLNEAALRAVREGALQHAYKSPMRKAFIEALIPLYQKSGAGLANYSKATTLAYADNGVSLGGNQITGQKFIDIEIISPNKEIFSAFAQDMYTLVSACENDIKRESRDGSDRTRCKEVRYRQIPNDNLNIRPNNTKNVIVRGQALTINLQDANLLKIRVHWCAPLDVPLVSSVFYAASEALSTWNLDFWEFYELSGGNSHEHWSECSAKTASSSAGGKAKVYYIPISVDSITRMQSAIRCEGDEVAGRVNRCTNLE